MYRVTSKRKIMFYFHIKNTLQIKNPNLSVKKKLVHEIRKVVGSISWIESRAAAAADICWLPATGIPYNIGRPVNTGIKE